MREGRGMTAGVVSMPAAPAAAAAAAALSRLE